MDHQEALMNFKEEIPPLLEKHFSKIPDEVFDKDIKDISRIEIEIKKSIEGKSLKHRSPEAKIFTIVITI